ncbi:MAG: hypothetical protein ACXVA9_05070 [Bdellovibrionales bacterium]
MTEPIKETIGRWSLDRLQFMLAHIEGFIDDENAEIKERAREFVPADGLDKIEKLLESDPSDVQLPHRVLERLSAFYDAGLLLQRGPAQENAGWWVTDLFWRGNIFHLEIKDQVQANRLVPEVPPLQVNRMPAQKMLETLNLKFLSSSHEADAFLLKPTPTLAYVLISNLGAPWSGDHIAHTQRLVNKCFIY